VFVLDVSGSMAEEGKIDKAKRALEYGIRGLGAGDRFNVIAFSGDTRLMESGLIQATAEGRRRGTEFVRRLAPQGGTNIDEALVEGMRQFPRESGRPRMLVFLTDGLPTVGDTAVARIIEHTRNARQGGVRLFTFGVGYDVNTRLLDRVAAENGGVADYVDPREDLEVKVSAFFDKVNHPVLSDVRVDMGGVRTDLVYPRAMPDLFRGTQLVLVGRYRNDRDLNNVTLQLSGHGSGVRTYDYPGQRFPLRAEENDWLPRLWATRRVGWLMEQIRSNGEQRELVDEVTQLGTRYGIVTPYTSFLALEPGAEVQRDEPRPRPRPVPMPRDRRGGVLPSPQPPPPPPPPAPPPPPPMTMDVTGQGAVAASRAAREMQDAQTVTSGYDAGPNVQRVGDKTFYLREEVWTDAEIKADTRLPETTVTFGSDEYYALLRQVPALARYFALGERVAVIHEGRLYRVRASTTR